LGVSTGSRPHRTKSFSDFNETFSVDRAFNSKHFDKKKFLKSFCFHREKFKILLGENPKNGLFYTLERKFLLIFSTKMRSKSELPTGRFFSSWPGLPPGLA
jgi:hypothetical protein